MTMIHEKRRNELCSILKQRGNQHIFLFDPANIFYYTGFLSDPHERFMSFYMDITTGDTHFFVPALDKEAAAQAADVTSIIPITDEEDPFDIVQQTLPSLSGTIGVEGNVLTYNRSIGFQNIFTDAQLCDTQTEINKQRTIKSPEEISAIRTAIRIIEDVLHQGMKKVQIGMTEQTLTAELEYLMRKAGADGPSFATIVLAGEKAALPHGIPGERKIQQGDVLLIDFGVVKDGYCSDITRTFTIGEPTAYQQEMYEIVLQANEAGIRAAKAGVALKDIDRAARKVIEDYGYGEYYHNRVGHGLGIDVHEEPSVHGANEALAKPGMVFTIEPGIYLPGDLGIRIEDIIHITEKGEPEVLTSFPKHLQSPIS